MKSRRLILIALAVPLIVAMFFPIVTDESYYVDWARRSGWPALGFFDHPPMVSWLAGGVNLIHHIFAGRLAVWVCDIVSLFYIWKTAQIFSPLNAQTAALVFATSVGGIAAGFLLTPDVGLGMFWSIAIYEGVLAIRGQKLRWLTAGLATGLGILSKYTMVLIGPVFLLALIYEARSQLRTWWPYLGGLVCILVLAPHLWWQSQNHWVTLRFQFGHGFSVTQHLSRGSLLPKAVAPEANADEVRLRNNLFLAFNNTRGFDEVLAKKPHVEKSRMDRAVQYVGDFWGGVAGLWGIYALVALASLVRPSFFRRGIQEYERAGFSMIVFGVGVPLVFFGLLSPFSKIEANWPAMHMGPLAILVACRWRVSSKLIRTVFAIHLVAIVALGYVLTYPQQFAAARNNRLLLEAKGFQSLGAWVRTHLSDQIIAVDSYQLKSAVRYFAPNTPVVQWPGITRDSEYTRGFVDDTLLERAVTTQKKLVLISLEPDPQELLGFRAIDYAGIRVCPDGSLGVFSTTTLHLPCERGLREWWMTTYVADTTPRLPPPLIQKPR